MRSPRRQSSPRRTFAPPKFKSFVNEIKLQQITPGELQGGLRTVSRGRENRLTGQ